LEEINPWWEKEDWENYDKHIRKLSDSQYRYRPPWIDQISITPFSLNFLLGPRQVGKTTGLKLLVEKLIGEGRDPTQLIYIDCELFPNFVSLRECLLEVLSEIGRELFIFLDEASALDQWWKAVKFLVDAGKLENCVVLISGSSSLRLRKDTELFPGRRGGGCTIEFLPLGFPEFLELHGIDRPKRQQEEVASLFKRYLVTGGFLSVINGEPVPEILKGFVNELAKAGKSLEIVQEVLASLISKIPSPVSYRAIASETSGYSYKVVQEYLEILRELYVLEFAYLRKGKDVMHRKDKKIFFRDPLLLRILSQWCGQGFLESALYEGIVQEHVLRTLGEVYYYRNAYEIDIVAGGLRVEVKAGKPHRRYPRRVEVLGAKEIPAFLVKLGETRKYVRTAMLR
jgi:hypothetical protein